VRGLGGATGLGPLAAADLHGSSYALFGLALYAAILLRTRAPAASSPAIEPALPVEPARASAR
jgi:hypothetical protein